MAKAKEEKKGEKTFQERIKDLEQKWGVQQGKAKEKAVVSTGSYQLNRAMGTGGYVKGKIVEIFGPESTGKSTIVLHALKEHQLAVPDRVAVLIDFEHSFDLTYAKRIGVDLSPERWRLYQPDYMEQGYEMVLGMAENKMASVIVIDSHTSAIPKVVLEGDMTDATYAAQARVNSMFLLKSKSILDRTDTSLLAISQLRSKIGGMSNEGDKPTGGNGWKFYADMRFKLWKKLEKEKELNETHVDVVKNKCVAEGQLLFVYPGVFKKVEDLTSTDKLLSFDGTKYLWCKAEITDYYKDECFEIVSKRGRKTTVNREHPFLTSDGYKPLRELLVGDKVALSTQHATADTEDCNIPPRLLAMLIADGDITGLASTTITDNSEDFVEVAQEDMQSFPGQEAVYKNNSVRCGQVVIRNVDGGCKGKKNQLLTELKQIGLFGNGFENKFIPACVINETIVYRAEFLLRYLLHDGSIEKDSNGDVVKLRYYTSSLLLKEGIIRLLNSVGIFSSVSVKKAGAMGGIIGSRQVISKKDAYTITIGNSFDIQKFINLPYQYDGSQAFISTLRTRPSTNRKSLSEIYEREGLPYFIDTIKEINPVGRKMVYTIHVPGTNVFDCGGFITHNCAPPFGEGVFNINWGEGIDNYLEILDMALEYKLMTRNGSWYSHQGSNIANGKDAMRQFFQDNDAFYSEIRDQVMASFDQTVEKVAVEETGSIATITPKEAITQ